MIAFFFLKWQLLLRSAIDSHPEWINHSWLLCRSEKQIWDNGYNLKQDQTRRTSHVENIIMPLNQPVFWAQSNIRWTDPSYSHYWLVSENYMLCECVRLIINVHPRNVDVEEVKTISLFSTIATHSVLLCYTATGLFRWVRWDPKWPGAPWKWVGMTFQVFRVSSVAQIAFTILLATSIGDKMLYSDSVYCLRQGGVTKAVGAFL